MIFPEIIKKLPKADFSINGATIYISQAKNHQIAFMRFEKDVDLPNHSHDAQWEIVIDGQVDLIIDGITKRYKEGDHFFIPKGVEHSGKIHSGYTSIAFFNQKNRYSSMNYLHWYFFQG